MRGLFGNSQCAKVQARLPSSFRLCWSPLVSTYCRDINLGQNAQEQQVPRLGGIVAERTIPLRSG